MRSLCEARSPSFAFSAGRLAVEFFSATGCIILVRLLSFPVTTGQCGTDQEKAHRAEDVFSSRTLLGEAAVKVEGGLLLEARGQILENPYPAR